MIEGLRQDRNSIGEVLCRLPAEITRWLWSPEFLTFTTEKFTGELQITPKLVALNPLHRCRAPSPVQNDPPVSCQTPPSDPPITPSP